MGSEGMRVAGLDFAPIAVDGDQSLAVSLPRGHRRGIYIYRFADGRHYAGKSKNVASRHAEHLREYRREGRTIERMWFAEVESRDERVLDDAESNVIASLTRAGYDLTNIQKTSMPGGSGDVVMFPSRDRGIVLPWDRSRRPMIGCPPKLMADADGGSRRAGLKRLRERGDWAQVLPLLARYVGETIPAPDLTAGTLWVATAYPSTRRAGLPCVACVSCGNVETLVLTEDEGGICGYLNLKVPDGRHARLRYYSDGVPFDSFHGNYGTADDVVDVCFDDLHGLGRLLSCARTLDRCYRLNVETMRRGPSMYRRFCNAGLVNAILMGCQGDAIGG